ncbi:hypothetical protein [Herbiconiux sp.]|uniref:hypothetical protein n=1 Tax=Herbiconiux sp. TaxID=1871186 RepID=UPI0025B8F789|nr:hypothetical protein [Herbiconiux sp.]
MAWFKVDDGFFSSRKVLSIPKRMRLAAVGLWTLAGTWSAKELTDGEVPEYMIEELGATQAAAEALVSARLWTREANVFHFANWDEYQPSAASIEDSRAAAKQRQAEYRARKAGVTPPSQRDKSVSHSVTAASVTDVSQPPDPTRPDPTVISLVQPPAETGKRPATAYPDDFEQWWASYPRRESKGDALKAWNTLKKSKLLPPLQVLVMASEAYAARSDDPQFIKLPAGWLRAHKWNDEKTTAPAETGPAVHPQLAIWLDQVGLTHDEYLERKDEPGFVEAMNRRRQHG